MIGTVNATLDILNGCAGLLGTAAEKASQSVTDFIQDVRSSKSAAEAAGKVVVVVTDGAALPFIAGASLVSPVAVPVAAIIGYCAFARINMGEQQKKMPTFTPMRRNFTVAAIIGLACNIYAPAAFLAGACFFNRGQKMGMIAKWK